MRFTAVAIAVLLTCFAASEVVAGCWYDQQVATVCTEWEGGSSCHTEIYYYEYCTVGGGGGTGGGGTGGGGGGGGYSGSYYDSDANGVIDSWRGVVNTSDECANNFDTNDRLGTDHGGPNTVRPGHSGVDIQANYGDAVYPMKDGTVDAVGTSGDCGYRVRVKHFDGTYSTYCHMVDGSAPLQTGASVMAGATRIGSADSTGSSSGDHVHITYLDSNMNNAGEYFNATDSQPSSTQLNAGGC